MYRVELPGPKVTKDIAADAKVRIEVPRSQFNELAIKGRVRDWRKAFQKGERMDDLKVQDGVKKLGALAVGGPKMKLQKRCVRRMFEAKGTVLDLEGVYDVALDVL